MSHMLAPHVVVLGRNRIVRLPAKVPVGRRPFEGRVLRERAQDLRDQAVSTVDRPLSLCGTNRLRLVHVQQSGRWMASHMPAGKSNHPRRIKLSPTLVRALAQHHQEQAVAMLDRALSVSTKDVKPPGGGDSVLRNEGGSGGRIRTTGQGLMSPLLYH